MENDITLSKLIGLLLFCPPPLCFVLENSKNTRNELARPVMGAIFLVLAICLENRKCSRNAQGVRKSHHSNAHEQ